jgi:hypothetical protein
VSERRLIPAIRVSPDLAQFEQFEGERFDLGGNNEVSVRGPR